MEQQSAPSRLETGGAIPPEAHKLRGRRLAKCPRTDEEAARAADMARRHMA